MYSVINKHEKRSFQLYYASRNAVMNVLVGAHLNCYKFFIIYDQKQ